MQSVKKENYAAHVSFCEGHKPLQIRMPESNVELAFDNWHKTQKNPYVVYADLEAINVATTIDDGTLIPKSTFEIERQYPACYGAVLVDTKKIVKLSKVSIDTISLHYY